MLERLRNHANRMVTQFWLQPYKPARQTLAKKPNLKGLDCYKPRPVLIEFLLSCPFPLPAFEECASRTHCGHWCARHALPQPALSIRYLSVRAKACAKRSAPCPECSISPWTKL